MTTDRKTLPFDETQLVNIYQDSGCPAWIYNKQIIESRIDQLKGFDVVRFAQKANSNINILKIMRAKNIKVDAVSLGEIERALLAGYKTGPDHDEIVFTADIIDDETLQRVIELDIPVNAGSLDMLEKVGQAKKQHRVWLRINPGFGHGHSQKTNTGGENSKHGIWYDDLANAIALINKYDLALIGIHMHIGSGVDYSHLEKVCDAMVELVKQVKDLGATIHAISAGGGLSIPYKNQDATVDIPHYLALWDAARKKIESLLGRKICLELEPGRFLVAESGVLITKVYAKKRAGENTFVMVDAGFNDLMRPAMYGSYHEISVIKAKPENHSELADESVIIAGPLCESGDVFTQLEGGMVEQRNLPTINIGDWLVFHDAGAYGASMSSNYNTRRLLPEYLIDGEQVKLIRKRQSFEDLFKLEL